MERDRKLSGLTNILVGVLILVVLYVSSLFSYLLFHSTAELFSMVVAGSIFMIAWNARKFMDNNYLLFLGIAYLFVGGLDLFHTLSYAGMGVFPGYGTNLPTQLWIAARYMESISLLIAPIFLTRRLKSSFAFVFYTVIFVAVLTSIYYWHIFPDCFIQDTGLTPFKRISEYIIGLILLTSLFLLYKNRSQLDKLVLRWLAISIAVTILSELAFTGYIHAYDFANFLGHLLKIISFVLIYKAIIVTGLARPYSLLFRNLKQREEELEKALKKVKQLRGMLPICAYCKKIRDDKGYWQQVEIYIHQHSEADFSHSICPECMKKVTAERKKEQPPDSSKTQSNGL
jgi:hypothetical protein